MGRSVVTWTMDDVVFLVVRFFSFKNLVYLIIFAFALPLLAWIFVAKNEPSMDFAAAMEMQVLVQLIAHHDFMRNSLSLEVALTAKPSRILRISLYLVIIEWNCVKMLLSISFG